MTTYRIAKSKISQKNRTFKLRRVILDGIARKYQKSRYSTIGNLICFSFIALYNKSIAAKKNDCYNAHYENIEAEKMQYSRKLKTFCLNHRKQI